jgi:hypothetical protein
VGLDTEDLPRLTPERLAELGVAIPGHRNRIASAASHLPDGAERVNSSISQQSEMEVDGGTDQVKRKGYLVRTSVGGRHGLPGVSLGPSPITQIPPPPEPGYSESLLQIRLCPR